MPKHNVAPVHNATPALIYSFQIPNEPPRSCPSLFSSPHTCRPTKKNSRSLNSRLPMSAGMKQVEMQNIVVTGGCHRWERTGGKCMAAMLSSLVLPKQRPTTKAAKAGWLISA